MILRAILLVLPIALTAAVATTSVALAQQYRWTDDKGRVHLTDAPPPASAKNVRRIERSAAQPEGPPLPFEIARLQKDFPVTLYTAPSCKNTCEQARAALNQRGVPFSEFQVWNAETTQKLNSVAGSNQVPVLVVGRVVQRGFDQGQFDTLLSSSGYPEAGAYPARNQGAPALPEGYTGPEAAAAKPPAAPPAPKSGPYDASGLTGPPPKPGKYGIPGESK